MMIERIFPIDLDRPLLPLPMEEPLTQGDGGGMSITALLLRAGEKEDLSGLTAEGLYLRPDGDTVALSGRVTENLASVTLSADCLSVAGPGLLLLRLRGASLLQTVLRLHLDVREGGA